MDRTALIRVVEETGKQVIINRPPRFGKSLHVETCFWYYDKSVNEEKRNELFEGTDIGANPTPLRGQFIVLKLDLSGISGSIDQIRERMTRKINDEVHKVVRVHRLPEWVVNPEDGLSSIRRLANAIDEGVDAKLMILVDEYDRFANQLLLEDRAAYDAVLGRSSGTTPTGPLRALVETFKEISTMLGSRFRSLITGVSPIALHDASGYNVAENLSLSPNLGDSFGFTVADVERGLHATLLPEEERALALKRMTEYYDGYRFPGSTEDVFNPQQCLFFLKQLISNPTFRPLVTSDKTSEQDLMDAMRDSNVAPSGRPVTLAAQSGVGSTAVFELSALTADQAVSGVKLRDSFGVRQMLSDHLSTEVSWEESRSLLVSYLFYQGACTLSKDGGGFVVPNQLQKEDFLNAVAARRASLEFSWSSWLDSIEDSAELRELLSKTVEDMPAIAMDGFSEAAFQSAVAASLRSLPVRSEFTLPSWKRVDLLFSLPSADVVVELKRVQGSQLLTWRDMKAKRHSSLFYKEDTEKMSHIIGEMTEERLLKEVYKTYMGRKQTVDDLLCEAMSQASTYAEELALGHKEGECRAIHCFAAALVHDRVIVAHKRFQ